MTKLQRRKIYEKVLWCIGFSTDEEEKSGVCWLLKSFDPRSRFCDLDKVFPEFMNIKTEMLKDTDPYAGWTYDEKGNAQRRLALEKAIQLTYA